MAGPEHQPSHLGNVESGSQSGQQHQRPIGVFDSGVGGLTVLRELERRLPHESFIYLGDTAHVPYGTRSADEVLRFSRQILDWLAEVPVKMAIMACNTSSALALDQVRSEYPFPILGIILPGARAAAIHGSRIGVMATPATVNSDCYRLAILEKNPDAIVTQVACPEFVPLIEQNLIQTPETLAAVNQHLQPLLDANIDTLVYGCTHYPHLAPVIEPLLPATVTVMNPAEHMAKAVAQELEILQLHNVAPAQPTRFYASGCPIQFASGAARWLAEIPQVTQVLSCLLPGSEAQNPAERDAVPLIDA